MMGFDFAPDGYIDKSTCERNMRAPTDVGAAEAFAKAASMLSAARFTGSKSRSPVYLNHPAGQKESGQPLCGAAPFCMYAWREVWFQLPVPAQECMGMMT